MSVIPSYSFFFYKKRTHTINYQQKVKNNYSVGYISRVLQALRKDINSVVEIPSKTWDSEKGPPRSNV